MSCPLVVVTQSGPTTVLHWWANMRVEGNSVVLASSSEEGWSDSSLVIAKLRSEGEAQAMFRTINERLVVRAHRFDARQWPGLSNVGVIRDEGEDVEG